MVKPLVEIYCEGNKEIGYGHVRRSITLANRLEQDGLDVRMIGLSELAASMLLPVKRSSFDAHIAIFDSPNKIDRQLNEAKNRGQVTVALDYFGSSIPDINIAVYPHKPVHAIRDRYVGFQYILIRNDIVSKRRAHPHTNQNKNVLVMLGGGDLLEQGHLVANYLCSLGLYVTLVQGPLAKNIEKSKKYRVLVNPPNLVELLDACDWAVTNGGGCLFEFLYLGKPTFALPQTDAELRIAHFALAKGALLGIGLDSIRIAQQDELDSTANKGMALVDGRGAQRVSEIIRGLF